MLTITLVAFESLAIATVMPVVSDDLGGLGLYGWVFSGFFLGSLLGIVLAGWAADRRGTRLPFAAGLALFTVGLVVGGTAPSMAVLVVGRVLQGAGAGVIPAVAYATVARSYPPDLRPRVFAVFSTAWVVPGLVGPAAASAIEHATSWRVVFLALLPLVAIAAALALPVLSDRGPAGGPGRRRGTATRRPTPTPIPTTGGATPSSSWPAWRWCSAGSAPIRSPWRWRWSWPAPSRRRGRSSAWCRRAPSACGPGCPRRWPPGASSPSPSSAPTPTCRWR